MYNNIIAPLRRSIPTAKKQSLALAAEIRSMQGRDGLQGRWSAGAVEISRSDRRDSVGVKWGSDATGTTDV
jgi:hypothetical protein